jgi:type 1 fimbriae regulatory protein FimE
LTPTEIQGLLEATGAFGRHGARDRTLLLLMYRDGLRVTEAISLRWDQVDLKAGHLAVQRPKSGIPSIHPLRGPELRAAAAAAGRAADTLTLTAALGFQFFS